MGVLPKINATYNNYTKQMLNNSIANNNTMHPISQNRALFQKPLPSPNVKTTGNANNGYTGTSKSTGNTIKATNPVATTPITTNIQSPAVPTASASPSTSSQYSLYQQALAAQKQNAQNAYNRNSAAINSMYSNRLGSLNDRYSEGRSALDSAHAAQQEAIRKAKEEAQRQAYISSMVAERDMQQNLSAQGLSGGASESTLAKLRNNYANNRNSNEEEYLNTSADIGIAYQNELANLENQYQQLQEALEAERAQAIMQNENSLANSEAATISQFVDHANSLDYLNAQSALNLAAQEKMAALNQQYALEQMEREQANKLNYAQFSNNLSERSDNFKTLKAYLRANGYTDEDIAAVISSYS